MNPFDHQDERGEFIYHDAIPTDAVPLISGGAGQYVAVEFANAFPTGEGFTVTDRGALLAGPEHPLYWDTWSRVLANCVIHVPTGVGVRRYNLWQSPNDGSLYLVPERKRSTLPKPAQEQLEDASYAFTYADKLRLQFIKSLVERGRISDEINT